MNTSIRNLIVGLVMTALLTVAASASAQQREAAKKKPRTPVLLVTDDAKDERIVFVRRALNPSVGKPLDTGTDVTTVRPDALVAERLKKYQAIYLLDVKQLSKEQIAALENRVREGAGLCIFLGRQASPRAFTRDLYKGGKGLLPVPITGPADLKARAENEKTDVIVEKHPVLKTFEGELAFTTLFVRILRYQAIDKKWSAPADENVRVIAKLRNGAPFLVVSQFGKGRVLTYLTAPDRKWTLWQLDVSWLYTMLDAQAWLTEKK